MDDSPRSVVVVVPALDEEDLVGACLDAIAVAAGQIDLPVRTVVVVNGSTDATAAIAARSGALVMDGPRCPVGMARDLGARRLLGRARPWIATTDADSIVPPTWLADQLASAADAFVGTVALDPADRERHPNWVRDYALRIDARGHTHVHGANLGVRADWYERVGGFRPLDRGEDVDLVRRLTEGGAQVARSTRSPVVTSARHTSRLAGGVATDLAGSDEAGALRPRRGPGRGATSRRDRWP